LTQNFPLQALINTCHQAPYPSPNAHCQMTNVPQSMLNLIADEKNSSPAPSTRQERRPWNTKLPTPSSRKHQKPAPYRKNLTPLPSSLRPHCPASQKLRLWHPLVPRISQSSQISDKDLKHIEAVMAHAWEADTHTTYASGLLNYMVFCDKKNIPEKDRAPVSQLLLMSFVSTLAAAYSGATISNYVHGIRAWHILHGVPWRMEKMETDALLKATEKLTPPSSKCKKRCPYTINFMLAIWRNLDLNTPLGASVFACLTTCFFATGHVGEFMIQHLDIFNPNKHVSRARVHLDQD